jgi:peptidoglycan/LPS O-acetylase OafA/YrhL
LAFGLLVAYGLRYHAALLRRWRHPLLMAGLAMWTVEAWSGYSPTGRLYGHDQFERGTSMLLWACDLTWLGVAFALMMPWAAHANVARTARWVMPITWVSAISYALYLVHLQLLLLPLDQADREHWHLPGPVFALVYVVAAFGAAALLHHLVERPFMRWRDRRWGEL